VDGRAFLGRGTRIKTNKSGVSVTKRTFKASRRKSLPGKGFGEGPSFNGGTGGPPSVRRGGLRVSRIGGDRATLAGPGPSKRSKGGISNPWKKRKLGIAQQAGEGGLNAEQEEVLLRLWALRGK